MPPSLSEAKKSLEKVINKSRVHLYKPIQIAEILYRDRVVRDIDLGQLETYRTKSKGWRDEICIKFLGRTSTSSARFQDNLFEENAIPPRILKVLGKENRKNGGVVEAFIYKAFAEKHLQLENALGYCLLKTSENFSLQEFIAIFWEQAGLKRSLDKIFEIIVYSLFETLVTTACVKVDIHFEDSAKDLLLEFHEFTEKVLGISPTAPRLSLDAHFYRVGVTNAADRGLDIFANFGSVIQVKHLSLNTALAEDIVSNITAHKIVIVCKDADSEIIASLLTQIGWKNRIQSIVTIENLLDWYNRALKGDYSKILGSKLLETLSAEINSEFPSVGSSDFDDFINDREYRNLAIDEWKTFD